MGICPGRKKKQPTSECEGWSVRFLLAAALALLFLWLGYAQTASGPPCEASPRTAVSLLLSPLVFYSWLTSALAELLLATPALVLVALHRSLLLLLAGPWALLCFWLSLALTCLKVVVYILHLALALGVTAVAILTPRRDKMATDSAADETPENHTSSGYDGPNKRELWNSMRSL